MIYETWKLLLDQLMIEKLNPKKQKIIDLVRTMKLTRDVGLGRIDGRNTTKHIRADFFIT